MICDVIVKKDKCKSCGAIGCKNIKVIKKSCKNKYMLDCYKKIGLLKKRIEFIKTDFDRKSKVYSLAFDSMENIQNKLKDQLIERENQLEKCKKEADLYLKNELDMQRRLDELKRKGEQFDAIQENLSRIHKKAQLDAQDVIDCAKEEAMDILSIVDELNYEINIFRKDIKKIINDLSIGAITTEDRLNSILYVVEDLEKRMKKAKLDFYNENHIPLK